MFKPKSHFIRYLGEQGLKMTPERERILEEIFATEGHFEADELTYRLRGKGEKISKATVYRTLPLLVQAGLLKEVIHGEKHLHYEHVHEGERHDHLICLKCGKIIEFEDEALETLQKRIAERYRFQTLHHRLELYGRCANCGAKRRRSKRKG